MLKPSRPKISATIIFVTVVSVFLYLANLVVYEALANIFSLASSQLLVLGISLGVLSASLIISTVTGMRFYNTFTRIYSTVAAVWMGLFVYLFLASVIYGIANIFPLYSANSLHIFGMLILLCAVFVSLYGIIHARRIYIVEKKVGLQKLPASWQHKKIVWVSDLHLGQIHGRAFAAKIKNEINKIKPDIVFIGGDLFDGTSAPDLHLLIEPLKELVSTHGTYFITGNHEEFGNNTKFIDAIKSIGIKVLQDESVDVDEINIIGVDYETTSSPEGFKNILSSIFARPHFNKNSASILLKHEPRNIDIARDAGISLQISGHTHRAQQWPLEYIARMVYGKYFYGLKSMGDLQVYTSSGVGTWGPPMRVGTNSEIVVL